MKDAKADDTAGSIGFYTSGQLFAEENYTLGVIGRAGIGTLHDLADYIGLLLASEERLVRGWEKLRSSHRTAPDIGPQSALFTTWSRENAAIVRPHVDKYGERREGSAVLTFAGRNRPPNRLRAATPAPEDRWLKRLRSAIM